MNNNDLYIIFQEALCDTLEKAAATEDEDVQRTGTKRLAAGGAAVGTYLSNRGSNLRTRQTIGSRAARAGARVQRGYQRVSSWTPENKTGTPTTRMPAKAMKTPTRGRVRSGGKALVAGLAANYLAGKGYDAVKGGKKQAD